MRTSSQHRLRVGRKETFFFLFFCNMLGVDVAKSSLHLHFLKTLEFRTDVSVTSMPGVAGPAGLATPYPPSSRGDPGSETQSNSLPRSFCSSCIPPGLVHANKTFGHQTPEGLCVSALLGTGFSHLLNLGADAPPVERGCQSLPHPGPLGLILRC